MEDLKQEVQRLNEGIPDRDLRVSPSCRASKYHAHRGAWSDVVACCHPGKPIPAQQQKKPARNWRAAELEGFALEFSDSDDDAEDGGEEQPQVSKAASQESAADSWPLLAAALQADDSATGDAMPKPTR